MCCGRSAGEVLAQRPAGVDGTKPAAPLQFGHQQADDALQLFARSALRMAEHEAAAAAGRLEDLLQVVGNLLRGADLFRVPPRSRSAASMSWRCCAMSRIPLPAAS